MGLIRRPDQQHRPTNPVGIGVTPSNIVRAHAVLVGSAGGPQVKIFPNLNLAITTTMPGTGLAAADVASFGNLQQVIELPSGSASELQPALIGETLITYFDGDTAPALLILGPLNSGGAVFGSFTLHVSMSNNALKLGGIIEGNYNIISGQVNLQPNTVQDLVSGIISFYRAGSGVRMKALQGSFLIPVDNLWQSIPLVNSWANIAGNQPAQFELVASGKVHLRGAIQSGTSTTISSALSAAAQPLTQQQISCGATTITGVPAGNAASLFLQITTGGIITLGGLPVGAAVGGLVFNGEYALD